MHDSQTPLSGMLQMLNMQINCWFGGVGVGWMNYFAFLIIAVFISGLMVGRTPEFLGRKVEAREMKIATLVVLLHPFLILVGTGISAAVAAAPSSQQSGSEADIRYHMSLPSHMLLCLFRSQTRPLGAYLCPLLSPPLSSSTRLMSPDT